MAQLIRSLRKPPLTSPSGLHEKKGQLKAPD